MKKTMIAAVSCAMLLSACATDPFGNGSMSTTQKGSLIGALTGAAAGALISHNDRGSGALIGAIGGGLAGAAIGNYMKQQEQDFLKTLAPEISSGSIVVEKRADESILVTMTDSTAFDSGSAAIKSGFFPTLNKIAGVVNQYGKTTMSITGHTDNSGSDRINQPLSEKRARAVNDYLSMKNVAKERLSFAGAGSKQPRASNSTEEGKRLNRRVEILIVPVRAS